MPAKLSHRLKGKVDWLRQFYQYEDYEDRSVRYWFECNDCRWFVSGRNFATTIESANQHNARMNRSREVTL